MIKTIKNLFVPYEIALKLNKANFNELCFGRFVIDKKKGHLELVIKLITNKECFEKGTTLGTQYCIAAPMYQQVTDWLKSEYRIRLKIEPTIDDKVELFVYDGLCWKFINSFDDDKIALNKGIAEALKLI